MTNLTTKTYLVGVVERAIAYYEVEAEDARTAAENWQDGEFDDRDDDALDSEGPCNVREQQPDGSWRKLPASAWATEPLTDSDPVKKPYSVLLLYPDYANDSGTETYYAFVEAHDSIEAVAVAQQEVAEEHYPDDPSPADFAPLLVTQGHHHGEALFTK